jgi:hypothetical protein
VGGLAGLQASQKACQGARKVGLGVGQHGRAQAFIGRQVAVGADEHLADLQLQPEQGVQRQGRAFVGLESFVLAAHAAASPARQQKPGDGVRVGHGLKKGGKERKKFACQPPM